jgi:hypothetical protein
MGDLLQTNDGRPVEWIRLSALPPAVHEEARQRTLAALEPVNQLLADRRAPAAMQAQLDRLTGVVSRLKLARPSVSAVPAAQPNALDVAAAAVREVNPQLTIEQASVIALEQDPALYDAPYTVLERSQPSVTSFPVMPTGKTLESAAAVLRALDARLSEEQAIARALELSPRLYDDGAVNIALAATIDVDLPDGTRETRPLLDELLVAYIEQQAALLFPKLPTIEAQTNALFANPGTNDGKASWQHQLYVSSAAHWRSQSTA